MPEVTGEQLAELRPYIAGEVADERGEVGMSCPLHPDAKRSASIDLKKGCLVLPRGLRWRLGAAAARPARGVAPAIGRRLSDGYGS